MADSRTFSDACVQRLSILNQLWVNAEPKYLINFRQSLPSMDFVLHVSVIFVSVQYVYHWSFVAVQYILHKWIHVLLHYTCVVHVCMIIVGFSRCVGLSQSLKQAARAVWVVYIHIYVIWLPPNGVYVFVLFSLILCNIAGWNFSVHCDIYCVVHPWWAQSLDSLSVPSISSPWDCYWWCRTATEVQSWCAAQFSYIRQPVEFRWMQCCCICIM